MTDAVSPSVVTRNIPSPASGFDVGIVAASDDDKGVVLATSLPIDPCKNEQKDLDDAEKGLAQFLAGRTSPNGLLVNAQRHLIRQLTTVLNGCRGRHGLWPPTPPPPVISPGTQTGGAPETAGGGAQRSLQPQTSPATPPYIFTAEGAAEPGVWDQGLNDLVKELEGAAKPGENAAPAPGTEEAGADATGFWRPSPEAAARERERLHRGLPPPVRHGVPFPPIAGQPVEGSPSLGGPYQFAPADPWAQFRSDPHFGMSHALPKPFPMQEFKHDLAKLGEVGAILAAGVGIVATAPVSVPVILETAPEWVPAAATGLGIGAVMAAAPGNAGAAPLHIVGLPPEMDISIGTLSTGTRKVHVSATPARASASFFAPGSLKGEDLSDIPVYRGDDGQNYLVCNFNVLHMEHRDSAVSGDQDGAAKGASLSVVQLLDYAPGDDAKAKTFSAELLKEKPPGPVPQPAPTP